MSNIETKSFLTDETVYVLKWKCDHCGENAGFADARCLNCASPMSLDEIGDISDSDFEEVHDAALKNVVLNKMGWFCSSCSSYNRNLDRVDYENGTVECECKSCGNELNVIEDGDYILKDGPSASSPAGAIRAMKEKEFRILSQIQGKKTRKALKDIPYKESNGLIATHDISQNHYTQTQYDTSTGNNTVKNVDATATTPPIKKGLYWSTGTAGVLLAGFLAYKGFQEKDTIIYVDGFDWSRSIAIDSVQRLSKSDWVEDIDGSVYEREDFYDFLVTSSYMRETGREFNHNPLYCSTTPRTETYTENRRECKTVTTTEQRCNTTSSGGVKCSQVPVSKQVCHTIPETKTRRFEAEQCEYMDYKINDWRFDRNIITQGSSQDNPAPYRQDFSPAGNNFDLGSERESGRKELYTISVSYNNGEDSDTLKIPESIWKSLSITSECSAKASYLLGVNTDSINWQKCS